VRIVGCPTSRDPDGLARSSRNARLSAEERRRAAAIPTAIAAIAASARRGATEIAPLRAGALRALEDAGVEVEYLAFVDPETLEAVPSLAAPALLAVAARVGDVRLIDNRLLIAPEPKR
jgi:pantoate--beta-alanine ligase